MSLKEVLGNAAWMRLPEAVRARFADPTQVADYVEADGWFRFTMTVTHPVFGEMFYQTGRFHASGG
jgi:hypothetical protein